MSLIYEKSRQQATMRIFFYRSILPYLWSLLGDLKPNPVTVMTEYWYRLSELPGKLAVPSEYLYRSDIKVLTVLGTSFYFHFNTI